MTYPPGRRSPYEPDSQPPPPPRAPQSYPPVDPGQTQQLPSGTSDPYASEPTSQYPQAYGAQPYGSQPYGNQPYGVPGGDSRHGAPSPGQPEAPEDKTGVRGWHVAVAGMVALVLGLAIGLGAGGDSGEVADLQAEVDRLDAQVTARDNELAALQDQLGQQEQELSDAESELEAAHEQLAAATEAAEAAGEEAGTTDDEAAYDGATDDDAAADEPADTGGDEPADTGGDEPAAGDGEYAAGNYVFTDVQVGEDFIGGFDVRARVTNTGPARNSIAITATLFSGDSVVGTTTGVAIDVESDETFTLEMFSLDQYTDWDDIEFQVDVEF